MSEQYKMFGDQISPKLTLSPSEALAKILVLLENVKEWEGKDQALSLKQFVSLGNADQEFLYGRMLRELSPPILAKILRQSSKALPTLGAIDLNGNCLIHRGFQGRPKTEREFTLSDILQKPNEVGEEYFLSEQRVNTLRSHNRHKEIKP